MASCAASTERVGAPHALYADLQRAHPLDGPTFDGDVVVNVSDVGEAGASNVDGNIQPGEKVQVTFTIEDDAGAEIAPSAVSNLSAVVCGPTSNDNPRLNIYALRVGVLTGSPPFTIQLPEPVFLERVGARACGALLPDPPPPPTSLARPDRHPSMPDPRPAYGTLRLRTPSHRTTTAKSALHPLTLRRSA